ncbi:MAG TPA: hypothetical protein VIG38_07690 [Hyphomicrobium sp.]|jgi:hypothetical protein
MHKLFSVLATLAAVSLAPSAAAAADLYGDDVHGVIVDEEFDDGPVVIERERIIERRYYGPRAYIADVPSPVEAYERGYRPAYYPERYYRRAYDEW